MGIVRYQGIVSRPPSLAPTFLKLDIAGALSPGMAAVVLVFFLLAYLLYVCVYAIAGAISNNDQRSCGPSKPAPLVRSTVSPHETERTAAVSSTQSATRMGVF